MKKVLMLALAIVVSASVAMAQPGAIGVYPDPGAASCNLVDASGAGLLPVYVVQTLTSGSTGVQFGAIIPPCMNGASSVGWVPNWGVNIGDPTVSGASTTYGSCQAGTVLVGTINVFVLGTSSACCQYPVTENLDSGLLVSVSCAFVAEPAAGWTSTVNGNPTCDCNTLPTENATWGQVKSLYR